MARMKNLNKFNLKFSIIFLVLSLCLFVFENFELEAAEFSVKPSITVREEYDDNIYLTKDNKVHDYITRAMPSISMAYKAPLWDWTLDYTLHWWYYSKRGGNDTSHNLALASKTTLIKNFLYLDISDNYASVVLEPRNPSTDINLSLNRSDTNTFNISPYISYQLSAVDILLTGYRYTNIWYKDRTSIDRQMHTGFASLEHVFSPKFKTAFGAEYTADRPDRDNSENDQTTGFIKISYEISPKTEINAMAGYKWIDFEQGKDEKRHVYDAAIKYRFYKSGLTELKTASTFTASPLYGILETQLHRLSIRYGEILSLNGSVFHQRDRYVEINRKDTSNGVTAGFEYKPIPRFVFKASGSYRKGKFQPEGTEREAYNSFAGIDYSLTQKAIISLIYNYNKEDAVIDANDYTNNILGLQIKIII